MFEKFPQQKEKEVALDKEIYEEYSEVAPANAYEYLPGEKNYQHNASSLVLESGPRRKEMIAFLNDSSIQAPDLQYPKLEKMNFQLARENLSNLLEKLENEEHEEVVCLAYSAKIKEKLAEISMLEAARDGNDMLFSELSEKVYGDIDKDVADYTYSTLYKQIVRAEESSNPLVRGIAMRLMNKIFSNYKPYHKEKLDISDKDGEAKWVPGQNDKYHFGDKGKKGIEAEQGIELGPKEIFVLFSRALKEYELDDSWKVEMSETAINMSVSQKEKVIKIPENVDYKKSLEDIRGHIAHEIGVHVKRRVMGENSKLKLLGLGLDKYKDDEGVATFFEQQEKEASDFAGHNPYIDVCLAKGFDSENPRNFREVFEIIRDIYMLKEPENETDQFDMDRVNSLAFNRCVRIFRGTSGKTPGACFTKDILYRENIHIWELYEKDSPEMKRLLVGKYDPTNETHKKILDLLGY